MTSVRAEQQSLVLGLIGCLLGVVLAVVVVMVILRTGADYWNFMWLALYPLGATLGWVGAGARHMRRIRDRSIEISARELAAAPPYSHVRRVLGIALSWAAAAAMLSMFLRFDSLVRALPHMAGITLGLGIDLLLRGYCIAEDGRQRGVTYYYIRKPSRVWPFASQLVAVPDPSRQRVIGVSGRQTLWERWVQDIPDPTIHGALGE
jgi:hypothetical protein